MKRLFVLGALVLGACSSSPVYLKHPGTGDVVQCGPYDTSGLRHLAAAERERGCIEDFKQQGYQRMGSP